MLEAVIGGFVGMLFAVAVIGMIVSFILSTGKLQKQINLLYEAVQEQSDRIIKLEANAIAYLPPEIAKIVH